MLSLAYLNEFVVNLIYCIILFKLKTVKGRWNMTIIKMYLTSLIIFFLIDILWLGFIAKDFYRNQIGHLMAVKTNWAAAIIFYSVFIGGLVWFAVNPALEKESWTHALKMGALFGFMCYATYDMTNLATLENWPLKITLIDIAWGTILNSLTAVSSFFIVKFIS